MAICDFPKTSSKIGQTSTSCLQKFTIHFRRPDKLKQDQNAPYRGEYGFDWLRDEYIYQKKNLNFMIKIIILLGSLSLLAMCKAIMQMQVQIFTKRVFI